MDLELDFFVQEEQREERIWLRIISSGEEKEEELDLE